MNETEEVLAKLDERRKYIEGHYITSKYLAWMLYTDDALRRQVEKHKCRPFNKHKDGGNIWFGGIPENICDECRTAYPCTFIKEVAHDLGVSE